MNMMDRLGQQEDELQRDYDKGILTQQEFNERLDDLHREYGAATEQAAEEAYQNELGQW